MASHELSLNWWNVTLDKVVAIVNGWKDDLRLIMCALDCRTVDELKTVDYILHGKLQGTYIKQGK